MVVALVTELPRALRSGWLDGMAARGSFRRRFAWTLVLGGVAVACGTSSDLDVARADSGGAAAATQGHGGSSGMPATGGTAEAGTSGIGGAATWTGGARPVATGGVCGGLASCVVGEPCCSPNSYCVRGNTTCQCINGAWGLCAFNTTTGGAPPIATGGRATGGMASGGRASGGRTTGGTASGGRATGGALTGGTPCIPVVSLPDVGSACGNPGESQCDSAGHRCYCPDGIWNCDYPCPDTPPTSGSECPLGLSCRYPSGDPIGINDTICSCSRSQWYCITID
jgi:hypothetical protein